ncbi:MAG TPA: lysozyme [Fermentimonas sp.]|nr:lysozyme [Fermentimonas sp.]
MKTSSKGIELIKQHEGLRINAYLDAVGIWTIGYGHTGGVKSGDVISEKEAEEFLRADLLTAEQALSRTGLMLNQNQFDALISFIFNVGVGRPKSHPKGPAGFLGSTLLIKARHDVNDSSIADEFRKWKYGGGRILAGLVKRREEEIKLYFS